LYLPLFSGFVWELEGKIREDFEGIGRKEKRKKSFTLFVRVFLERMGDENTWQ